MEREGDEDPLLPSPGLDQGDLQTPVPLRLWRERFPLPDSFTDPTFHNWARSLDQPSRQQLSRQVADWMMAEQRISQRVRRVITSGEVNQEHPILQLIEAYARLEEEEGLLPYLRLPRATP